MSEPAVTIDPTRPRWRTAAGLALIVVLAATLRWHGLTARGFFFDELWHVEVSNGHGSEFFEIPFDALVDVVNPLVPETAAPLWQLPARTTGVTHPPGAFVSLRLWRDAFGDSMLALRSWSAAWSTLVVGLTFVAATISFGRVAGFWAALLCAIAPGNVEQAQDVRGYTMAQAMTLLTAIALLRTRGRDGAWRAAIPLGVGVMLMLFTHYFLLGAVATIAIGTVTLTTRGRARWQAIGAVVVGGVVWAVLWLPSLRAQLAFVPATADVFLADDAASPIVATIARAIAAPYQSLAADPTTPATLVPLAGGAVVWMLLALRARRGGLAAGVSRWWIAIVVATFGLLVAIDVARHTKHLDVPRYLVLAAPALCVVLAAMPRARVLVAIALSAAFCFQPTSLKPDLRPQLAWLRDRASPGDVILLPARPVRPHDAQSRYLTLAYGLRWPRHRIAIPVGPQPREWIDALPRDVRWFCLAYADYDPPRDQPGLAVIARGPVGSGVAAFEVRPADAR